MSLLSKFIKQNQGLLVNQFDLFNDSFPIGSNYSHQVQKIGFIRIPKNASRWAKYNLYFNKDLRFLKENQPKEDYTYHAFTRDPIERFYSGLSQFADSFCLNMNTTLDYFIENVFLEYIVPKVKQLDYSVSLLDIHLRSQYQYLIPFNKNKLVLHPTSSSSMDMFIEHCHKLNISIEPKYYYPDKKIELKNNLKTKFKERLQDLENNILVIYQQDYLLHKFAIDNNNNITNLRSITNNITSSV